METGAFIGRHRPRDRFFLNVHEGPQSISPLLKDAQIKPGMVTSNEPGLYREGEYGVRIENLVLAFRKEENEFGSFLAFETLTLCPYEKRLIDPALLDPVERDWLNAYHGKVFESLSPMLDTEEKAWLKEKTLAV